MGPQPHGHGYQIREWRTATHDKGFQWGHNLTVMDTMIKMKAIFEKFTEFQWGCTASTAMIPYGPSGTGSDPRVN